MVLIWVTAVSGHPLDVTQVPERRRISPSVQARERRGRGNQGRDERVVPGHAAMGMRPFTLETVVGLNAGPGLAHVLQVQPPLELSSLACAGAFHSKKAMLAWWGWLGCRCW